MKKRGFVFCIQLLMVILFVSSSAKAADWRFPLILTYVSGLEDVWDIYKNNMEVEGYYVESEIYSPTGISFHPYAQFDSGFGVGFSIGPLVAIMSNEANFFDIPIGLDFRYIFTPTANSSPYVRAGGRHHSASGDYVEGTTPGFFGGIGIEFLRDRRVNMGIEISYDASEIELEKKEGYYYKYTSTTEKVQPCGLMLSVFVIF